MAAQRTMQHPTHTPRVIRCTHHDDRLEMTLVTPRRKHFPFGFGARRVILDDFDVFNGEGVEQLHQVGYLALIRDAAEGQLAFHRFLRSGKNCHPGGNAAMNEIGCEFRTTALSRFFIVEGVAGM